MPSPDSGIRRKKRVVIDIRALNKIIITDVYPIPLQLDIINTIRSSKYISVVNIKNFFHQFLVAPKNREKLTIVSYKEQETYNIAIINFKNSPAYIQRLIDKILHPFSFARVFIDNVVIYSKTLDDHVRHLKTILNLFQERYIILNPNKSFIAYPSVELLKQRVNNFNLFTSTEKLATIQNLEFPRTLKKLKTYLNLTR